MKFFQSQLTLSLLISTTLLTNSSFAVDAMQKNQQMVFDSEFNNLLNNALKQLNRFEHTLEHLALLVYSEGKKFKNSDTILEYIKNTRSVINNVKASSFLVPKLGTIAIIQEINNALCQSLKDATSSNAWKTIDLGHIVKRSQNKEIDLNEVVELQFKNQSELEELETTIERFGLTYTQKAIRNLEDGYNKVKFYIEKNKLEPYIKWSAISAAAATYIIYQSEALAQYAPSGNLISKVWDNRFTRKIKSWIGSAPEYDKEQPKHDKQAEHIRNETSKEGIIREEYAFELNNPDKLGILGTADWYINQNAATELSYKTLIPGVTAGWMTNKILGDLSLYATIMPIMIKQNKTVNMATISNILFHIKNSDKFKDFKADTKHFFNKKYEKLRGKSSKNSLAKKPTLTFKDVIGLDYAKKEFETVIDYIINPDKFERTKLTPAKGYLMVGPPRTGKSHIAKAICGEINERQKLLGKPKTTNFIPLDADLVSDTSFYKVMEYINSKAPCIVFLDEIDLLDLNRGDGNKENKLLSQILTHMSGYVNTPGGSENSSGNKQVIFIGATNNPHSLDSALLQPGRFGKIISFEYPHLEERNKYIQHELEKRCITTLSDEFVTGIARELEGYTFEDIFLVITSAIQKASSEYMPVGEHHFRSAMEETIKTIMPLSKPLSSAELNTISSYQSGKALATKLLTPSVNISTLTTMPINTKIESKKDSQVITTPTVQYGGIFTYKNTDLLNLQSNNELKMQCKILLAGHVAQELILGNSYYTYRPEDQQEASSIAKQIALEGEKYQDLTEDMQKTILQKTYEIKNECKAEIKELLSKNLDLLKTLHSELSTKKHINEKSINELIAQ